MRRSRIYLAVLILVCLAFPAVSSGEGRSDCIWGLSAAWPSSDPGFEDLWKYRFEVFWSLSDCGGHALSHICLFLGLEDCECVCDDRYFVFDSPAGQGPGVGDCTVYYDGEFLCEGCVHFSDPEPAIKFEPIEGGYEPGVTGWAHLRFYSTAQPTEPGTFDNALGAKHGQHKDRGELVGVLPSCECTPAPVEDSSWGAIKSMYK